MTVFRSPSKGVRSRPGRWLAMAGALTGALVLSMAPASAQDRAEGDTSRDSRPLRPVSHPERDFMGSTIPDHPEAKGDTRTMLQIRQASTQAQTAGIDVSHWQGEINWSAVANDGIRFAYMKATEGTSYTDPEFDDNYVSSYNAGLIRGAYHFALPDRSSGAAQARFLNDNGGDWSADGRTLPPALDIEYNPYGGTCYGKSDAEMRSWIADFSRTTKSLSGRYPIIYTTTNWWSTCTGNWGGLADTNPLWIANWGSDPYPLPNGWSYYTIWQYTSTGSVDGISGDVDRDVFNGSYDRLEAFATCTSENPC